MSAPKLKVLVSGAGIAGPCFAYWLSRARLDVSITILERSPTPRATGQSIDVRGRAIDIIKAMQLEEPLRARNTTEEGTVFLNSSGKPFAHFKVGEAFTAEYEVLRADLSQLFLGITENLSNVKYRYGDSVKSLAQTEEKINVSFASGSEDTFDLVVAADGGTSRTRPMILGEETLKDSYKTIGQYIAFFSIPSRPTDPKLWQWYNAPKGLCIMLRPHQDPSTTGAYLCITMPSRGQRDPTIEDAMEKGTDATKRVVRKHLENAGWQAQRVLDGMDQADDFYIARAAQVKLPKWTNGRALVLGDAAHATFGVGTTLAIESAYILAGELSKIQSSSDIPQALERYEEVFRPIYKTMEDLPPGFPQLAMPQTVWGLRLRDALLSFVSKTKLYRLLQGGSEEKWKLPQYDWVDV